MGARVRLDEGPGHAVETTDRLVTEAVKGGRREVEIEFGTSGATIPDWYGDSLASDYTGKQSSEGFEKSGVIV